MGGATAGPTPEERRRHVGAMIAPVQARILLMLALTKTHDPVEIQQICSEY